MLRLFLYYISLLPLVLHEPPSVWTHEDVYMDMPSAAYYKPPDTFSKLDVQLWSLVLIDAGNAPDVFPCVKNDPLPSQDAHCGMTLRRQADCKSADANKYQF